MGVNIKTRIIMQLDKELTFTHYKEPLRAIPKSKGFGYYGAIHY